VERHGKTEKQIAESVLKISEHWNGLISFDPYIGGGGGGAGVGTN
jgi:hypothetical protein